jgi:hypothetical protein
MVLREKTAVAWIRIGFNVDPDLAFYLNSDPDTHPGSQTSADPGGTGSQIRLLSHKKLNFT